MCMRASGASELRKKKNHFHILKLLFFQYFVGTSDTLSVQMTCLSVYMYRQISKCTDKTPKKHYLGGSCPPLATLMMDITEIFGWHWTIPSSLYKACSDALLRGSKYCT